jgi:hypothetical protein
MESTRKKSSGLQIGIIILTLATAGIHLTLALTRPDPKFTPLFLLNAVGYIVLLVAYLLPQLARYHNLVRWVFMAFAVVTVIGYFIFNAGHFVNPIGLLTKAIEVVLIVLLWLDRRNS